MISGLSTRPHLSNCYESSRQTVVRVIRLQPWLEFATR